MNLLTTYLVGIQIVILIFHDTDTTKCHVAGGCRWVQGFGFSSLTPLFHRQYDFPGRLHSMAGTAGKQHLEICASSIFSFSSLLPFPPCTSFFSQSIAYWTLVFQPTFLHFSFFLNNVHLTHISTSVPMPLSPSGLMPDPMTPSQRVNQWPDWRKNKEQGSNHFQFIPIMLVWQRAVPNIPHRLKAVRPNWKRARRGSHV